MRSDKAIAAGYEGLSFATALQHCLACGVVVVDQHERILSATPEATRAMGLAAGLSFPASLSSLPLPLQQITREALRSRQPVTNRQVNLEVQGAAPTSLGVIAVPLPNTAAEAAVVLSLNDLTFARRLEAHLQQLDRLTSLGTLATSMAHEIKNALVAGKTFVELLLEKNRDAELGEIVRRELSRIDAIISRMLDFGGTAKAVCSPVHLHQTLQHSLDLVRPQLEASSISLHRAFRATSDLISGDDYELQQALVNLFLNAVEAMSPGGALTVTSETITAGNQPAYPDGLPQLPGVSITISDTGTGISPENMARLFEPFFTTKPTGTGLGLAITQRILREHHGAISVESQPGRGTAFRLVLPLLEASAD